MKNKKIWFLLSAVVILILVAGVVWFLDKKDLVEEKSEMLYYQSSFGFTSKLSKNWLILTKDQVMNNPNLLDFDNKSINRINPALLEQIKTKIMSGRTELMYSTKGSGGFGENINIMVTMGNLVKKKQENQLCTQMPVEFGKMFGRKIKFYKCGIKYVGKRKVLYLDFEGVVPGTRSAQYQFQVAPRKLVIATLTCKESSYKKLNKEFDDFIKNVKLDK
ncbi:MAG: hypothetical protein GY714_20525 [Desulfobacterales bacterium]|nr:hypothetical protein [Desulfobacterales bacterium]MCP4163268.1 hypothetical protein [Deltaproteobacteria bacterium]